MTEINEPVRKALIVVVGFAIRAVASKFTGGLVVGGAITATGVPAVLVDLALRLF